MTAQNHAGDRLGPYRLLERLGEGGMGVVYLAADADHRKVAVKALRPAVAVDPNARRRLAREVETMRRVRSPYVAEVIDADVTCDPPYIVTRYVSGRTLEEVVGDGGPLTGQALARVASGLALAMAAVHAAGVVHRDLKPGNVMLARGEPVVIDFGIAQVPDSTRLTQTGMFMGTPGYLAPEVIEGKQSGAASDVHSWGATVAFAATGRPPFGTGGFETIFYRIINGQPDLSGFPVPLLSLVAQALSRDPARRPTAAELCQRTAALDASALVPTMTAAAGSALPFAVPGTVAGVPAPTARPGVGAGAVPAVGPVAPAAWPPSTQPLAAGWGAGNGPAANSPFAGPGARSPGGIAGNGAGGFASAAPGRGGPAFHDYRDMLPPVQYAPGAPAPPRSAPAGSGAAARGTGRSPAGSLLVLATIAAAVGISIVFPLAGTVVALVGLMALRAAGQTAGSMSRRRSRKGARAGDPVLAVLVFPLALAWSAIRSLLFAPLALVAAALAAAITIVAVPHHTIPLAFAYAAGALVAFYGLGPGSGGTRRPLRKFYDAAAGTPVTAAVAAIAVGAVVAGTIVVAASHPPFFWPFSNMGTWLSHFTGLKNLVGDVRTYLLKVVGR
jgi:predicted Ser/Thr protein kinase